MMALVAALAVGVAVVYGFIGLHTVPHLARLAARPSGWIRLAQYGAAALLLGCALAHLAIAWSAIAEPDALAGPEVAYLVALVVEAVGASLFAVVASAALDVRLRTREEARLEAERERMREELDRGRQLESLGQLAGGIAHDFNDLLGVILSYGHFVNEKLDGRSELRADVAQIIGAAERGAELTHQMMVFGSGATPEPDSIDVDRVIEASAPLLQRMLGDEIAVELALEGSLPPVRLARGRLEQALLNLALNAREAMPEGGVLVIATREIAQEDRLLVRVVVSDTGEGMPLDVASQAFNPLFTTKQNGRGTGLGLWMVYGIVNGAGGRVELDSAPGGGTRITLDLPAERQRGVDEPFPARDLPQVRGATVLVVEDQAQVRNVIARTLIDRGAEVLEASDGDEALRLFEACESAIDVVLTDVAMPGISGVELVRRLRRERPALPVVYMSGYFGEHQELSRDAPLLPKPFSPDDLVGTVAGVLPTGFLATR